MCEIYTYDKVSRLESSTRNGRENYTFDAFGNLTAMNGLLRTTDPATNRLTEAAYDRRGNLLAWGGQSFTWDTMGRMTSMQGPGINRSMFYDANGERLVVRDGSGYTFTLRDLGQEVLREVSWSSAAGWKWGKDYVYRDGVLLASQSTTAGEGLRYHFPDHLTSPRLLTNRCGERAVEHRASSFGVDVLGGSSQSADRMRFTMHERDLGQLSTTLDDLDYMHARTYWPSLGRFMSVDPLSPASLQFGDADDRSRFAESIRQPGRWNRYAYVNNNPMKFIDPNGEAIEGALVATSPIFFSEGAATGGTVVATGAAPLVLAGAAGLALGYGVNQIPGVSEALTHQGLSDGLANIFFAGAANDTRQFIDTKVATVLKHVGQYGSPPPNDPDKRSRLKNVYERMKKHLEQAEKKLKNLKGKSKEEYARLIKQTAEKLEKWWQASS